MLPLPARIAVWNTAFLGDAVLSLPLLEALSTAFSKLSQGTVVSEPMLDFYVRPGLGSLFAGLSSGISEPSDVSAVQTPYAPVRVTEVPRRGFTQFLREVVRPRGHDLWLGAHPSPRAALASVVSGAPVRVGYSGGVRTLAYNQRVPRRFGELDEIERLLQLLIPVQRLYATNLPADFTPNDTSGPFHWPHLPLPPEAEAQADRLFAEHNLSGKPCVGLHPGSAWPTKCWPGFAGLAQFIVQAGVAVVVLAGPGEEALARKMLTDAGLQDSPLVTDFSGALKLPVLAACLKRLTVYVGNDSGPLHLAWCQHTPVTAIFGPTVRELGFFPRGERSTVMEAPREHLACRPCGLHGPKACPLKHHRCMTDISADAVWADVHAKLENRDE